MWIAEIVIGRWRRRLTDSMGRSGCRDYLGGREWVTRTSKIWSQRLGIPVEEPEGEKEQ